MPSLQWRKRNLFVDNLDASFTLNYNKNTRTNVDTAQVKYNWRGETHPLNSPGEQSLLHSRADNHNLNGTAKVDYTFRRTHTFTFSHTINAFERSNTSLLAKVEQQDAIKKRTAKHISGLSYVWTPSPKLTLSAFGKFYSVRVQGPVAVDANATSFTTSERRHQHWGYGTAAAYTLPLKGLSVKASYEKALRLPTIEELFGDEDLEQGAIGIRPELSHNANLSFIYNVRQKHHDLFAELGFIVRDTRDYIQRNIVSLSGGKQAASYVNYGKVMTKGMNLSLRYQYANLFNVGGHFTQMDARDNMRTMMGTSAENLLYKDRMPNLPYQFADFDATVHWQNFCGKGNKLSLTYEAQYTHAFSYYASRIGANHNDYIVPTQWAHHTTLSLTLRDGHYNLALECRNLTDARLYDNFSLQKPGRAVYAKLRIFLQEKK
jgi:outer membrane receptor protein involved in Fe transport